MSLDILPIFGWAMLIFAGMIVVAFPAVILATMYLEIERAFGWPFFTAAKGGDPLLWQHLFWFFGHPEVYIIFLPAASRDSRHLAITSESRSTMRDACGPTPAPNRSGARPNINAGRTRRRTNGAAWVARAS
jgi:hypothetical protein